MRLPYCMMSVNAQLIYTALLPENMNCVVFWTTTQKNALSVVVTLWVLKEPWGVCDWLSLLKMANCFLSQSECSICSEKNAPITQAFFSHFSSKLKGIKTQAFPKLNRIFVKTQGFFPLKTPFFWKILVHLMPEISFYVIKQGMKSQEKTTKLKEIL